MNDDVAFRNLVHYRVSEQQLLFFILQASVYVLFKLSKGLLKGCKTPKTDKNEKDLNLKESTTEPSSGLPIPLSILSNIPDIGLCALEEEPHCGSSDKTEV